MNDLDCFFASPDMPISHKLAYQCHIICCRSNGAADDGHDGEADEHPAGDVDGDEVAGQPPHMIQVDVSPRDRMLVKKCQMK